MKPKRRREPTPETIFEPGLNQTPWLREAAERYVEKDPNLKALFGEARQVQSEAVNRALAVLESYGRNWVEHTVMQKLPDNIYFENNPDRLVYYDDQNNFPVAAYCLDSSSKSSNNDWPPAYQTLRYTTVQTGDRYHQLEEYVNEEELRVGESLYLGLDEEDAQHLSEPVKPDLYTLNTPDGFTVVTRFADKQSQLPLKVTEYWSAVYDDDAACNLVEVELSGSPRKRTAVYLPEAGIQWLEEDWSQEVAAKYQWNYMIQANTDLNPLKGQEGLQEFVTAMQSDHFSELGLHLVIQKDDDSDIRLRATTLGTHRNSSEPFERMKTEAIPADSLAVVDRDNPVRYKLKTQYGIDPDSAVVYMDNPRLNQMFDRHDQHHLFLELDPETGRLRQVIRYVDRSSDGSESPYGNID